MPAAMQAQLARDAHGCDPNHLALVLHHTCPYASAARTAQAGQHLSDIAAALTEALSGKGRGALGSASALGGDGPQPPRLTPHTLAMLPTLSKQLVMLPGAAATALGRAVARSAAQQLHLVLDGGLPDMAMLLYALQRVDARDPELLAKCEGVPPAFLPALDAACVGPPMQRAVWRPVGGAGEAAPGAVMPAL
jgi:hypothetical protein